MCLKMLLDRIYILIILSSVAVDCAVLGGKALLCRDPDTGKLYAVNETWPATLFCGNYSCVLRKRNTTGNTNVLIREYKVTNLTEDQSKTTEKAPIVTFEKRTEPILQPLLHRNKMPDPNNMIQDKDKTNVIKSDVEYTKEHLHEKPESTLHTHKMHHTQQINSNDNDRYLTENEINNIASMLHTVKKSDLDAIVDIYNLAQDIYKEFDDMSSKEIENEAFNMIKEEELFKSKSAVHRSPSYWYEPMAYKNRLYDKDEMEIQGSHDVYSTTNPLIYPSPYIAVPSYNLREKVPYYYPATSLQRLSSYTHPAHNIYTPKYKESTTASYKSNENPSNKVKTIQPSLYLPYPFANIRPYNTTAQKVLYASPWLLDYYNNYRYYQPYYSAYIAPLQKPVLIDPQTPVTKKEKPVTVLNDKNNKAEPQNTEDENENLTDKDLVERPLKGQNAPNWKTAPIPMEVLKEIRADIDTSKLLKAFPLRKKVKLEKVGKVINVDEINNEEIRSKRFVPAIDVSGPASGEEFEAVLETITCEDQTRPGFFRLGNLTQPYPACCPKLITKT